jgi:hypothetical protein
LVKDARKCRGNTFDHSSSKSEAQPRRSYNLENKKTVETERSGDTTVRERDSEVEVQEPKYLSIP